MEIQLIKLIQNLNSNFLDFFCELISYFSSYFGFILLFLIFFVYIDRKYCLFFGMTYVIGIALNFIFKLITNRPRPYEIDILVINKLVAPGSSFPSGHSTSIILMLYFLLYYMYKRFNKKWIKNLSLILSIIFIIAVSFSRMYLGQHYLSDIIMGIILGLIYSYLGILCYNWINGKYKRNN